MTFASETEIFLLSDFDKSISFAIFLNNLPISLRKFLTPASLVYSFIIFMTALSENEILNSFNPFSSCVCGIKYFLAIFNFSNSVYDSIEIISILSRSGPGIPPKSFAVQMKNTFDKSKV